MSVTSTQRENAYKIFTELQKHYPHAKTVLHYSNAWELLVAVMLSAQCTDAVVNRVTEHLFKKYTRVEEYANADIKELADAIHSVTFFNNKAKNVKAAAQMISKDFNGKVPETMEELLTIPGVARKTANIVLGNAFGKVEGIAVDTHVRRLSQLYGWTKNNDPVKIEQDLMQLFDKKDWFQLTYLLIDHGRAVDTAKNPKKELCFIEPIYPHH